MRAIAFLLILSVAAHADQAQDEIARAHFVAGQSYYDAANYPDALKSFTEAYRLSQRPALLYNIAMCHERLGHLDRAIDALENYLAAGEAPDKRQVQERIANLKKLQAAPPPPGPKPVVITAPLREEPRPAYKKWWVWTLSLGAVAAVGLGVGLGVGLTRAGPPQPSWATVDLHP